MKRTDVMFSMGLLIVIFPFIGDAVARDLVSAASTTANTVKSVAQGLAVTGVIGGGAIMQIPGAGEFGKRVLISGLVGCLCAFGAPAFLDMMKSIFGGL
jgi:hypothetical protein